MNIITYTRKERKEREEKKEEKREKRREKIRSGKVRTNR